jgi:hypothetical protein
VCELLAVLQPKLLSAWARQMIVPTAQDIIDAIVRCVQKGSHLATSLGLSDRECALEALQSLQHFPSMPESYRTQQYKALLPPRPPHRQELGAIMHRRKSGRCISLETDQPALKRGRCVNHHKGLAVCPHVQSKRMHA